jgi:putative oxidoreductase
MASPPDSRVSAGATLAAGWCVVPLASWFALQISAGIIMVHAQNGWFVGGAGTGGAEYSVLIIAALVATALTNPKGRRLF